MIEVHLTGPEFADLSRRLKSADKKIQREFRKSIRKSGEDAVRDVRSAIEQIPSSGQYGTGVRAALVSGTTLAISGTGRTPGVVIRTSPSRLPAGKRPLAKAMNKAWFRHPVFGNREQWVNQPGHPYFGQVISEHYVAMRTGVVRAMVTAERELAAELSQG